MKRMASIVAAILTIASLATARSAFGADIATVVSNATDVTVTSDTLASGEALYVYTETGTEFKFNLSNQSKAWILVVGGGGAGGYSQTTANLKNSYGAGGGGGGGGLIETNGISLPAGTYTITVGAGGAAPANGKNGGDGNPSVFAGSTGSGILFNALGGGGGAASGNAGSPGGSGGGGSYYTSEKGGGAALNDGAQGNAGGAGGAKGGGAGGGGADGAGNPITSDYHAGQGGVGIISAIEGPSVMYAAGGGGGSNDYMGSGGAGDGTGNGAGATAATAGANGRGGGGGGGNGRSGCRPGAKGGSGIVIIRVTKIYGEVTPPVAKDFEYTGKEQNIWPEYDPSDCDLSADSDNLKQTAVGTYTFTATPKDGSCWKGTDGSTDPTNITWHIVKASNSLTLVQDGWVSGSPVDPVVSYKVTDDPSEPTFTYSTAEDGEYTTTMPTTPGVYWIKASIVETSNYDGATAGPVSFRILGTSESPIASLGFYVPITFPAYVGPGEATVTFTPAVANYQTKDNSTSALCLCSANGRIYPQSIEWTAGDVAELTVEFDDLSPDKTFYLCWGLVEGESEPTIPTTSKTGTAISPNTDTVVRDTSKTLQNYIEDLAMPSWRVGETPSEPEYRYKIGIPTLRYVGTGGYDSSEKPTEPGSYTLTVTIPEETGTDNYGPYSGVPATTIAFKIVGATESPMPDKELKYFSAITASDAVSAGKVTVNVPSSHNWVATYNDGQDVRFCDIGGNVYPSALSAWNGDGSAVFAVEVPAMAADDKFYMCWGETVEKSVPDAAAPSGSSVTAALSIGDTVVDTSLTLKNWIRDLKMSGFRLGDSPTVPTCVAKIGTVQYQYSNFAAAGFVDWDPSGTLSPGVYYMQAIVEQSTAEGYEGAVSESPIVSLKFRILGETESPFDALAWFAPVTATGALDSPASVTVTLPGTLDYRTIYNDGSDIRFSDADGNVLPSAAATAWATDGTAQFNVQVPAFSSSYKFYVCWGPVVGMELPPKKDITAGAGAASVTVGSAVRDETKLPLVNHWVTAPVFPAAWAIGDTVSYTPGDPAYGTFKILLRDIADPTGELTVITDLPDRAGDFELIACADAGDYWAGMTNAPFEVSVSKHDPSMSLTREHGAEGRVLLMNTDVTPGAEVYNQGYADNDPSYSMFWEHLDSVALTGQPALFCLSNETKSILWATNKSNRLWTLINCRHGNMFRKSNGSLNAQLVSLPWDSPNARDIGEHDGTSHTKTGTGQIVMQNTADATVYSSCFEDGIGTIYLDAVNSGRITALVKPEYFQLEISYATDCITSLGEVIDIAPTDEFVRDFDETEPEPDTITTNVNWQVVRNIVPIKILNGAIADTLDPTGVVTLDIDTSSDNSFYRLRAKLDITKPARFKIKRTGINADGVLDAITTYLLIDNIIVSYPAMRASITTYGDYDSAKKGKQVIGQQAALSEVFPSVGSDNVFARGMVSFYTNGGLPPESINTNDFITSARFNYRWRYLNQSFYHDGAFSSVDDGKFASVRLSKADDYAISTRPLDLPGLPGDIEYWYELVLGAPYYKYVDYSGLGIGVGDYTEEITSSIGRADASFSNLPSGGTNWFVRVREGASKFERMTLVATDSSVDPATTDFITMDLVGDHQWRGFIVVTNKTERDLTFYIQGVHPQVDGETIYDESGDNDIQFCAREATIAITNSPYAGVMAAKGEETGYYAKLHYLTNVASYVEVQFNDETRAVSISHADYQDFNEWFSSRWEDDAKLKFYSSAHETNSTTIAKRRYPAAATNKVISTFAETPRTDDDWFERFYLGDKSAQEQTGFPKNVPFQSERTPQGWLADQGMWVAQKWGMTNSIDFALQLEGRGKGSVTFNQSPTPNGLDTIEFSTRLAQFNEFDDISFSWENIIGRKNYTIAAQACFDTDSTFANFSGEASVSLFTGYVPNKGCYEYRITIYNLDAVSTSDGKAVASVSHAIYKWKADGAKFVAKPLVEVNYSNSDWYWTKQSSDTRETLVGKLPLGLYAGAYSGMFMSFSNANNTVVITAGVSKNPADKKPLNVNFAYDTTMMQVGCVDSDPVTTFGTYGVAIKNCPGRILYPRVYSNMSVPIPDSETTPIDSGYRWEGTVDILGSTNGSTPEWQSTDDKLNTYWGLRPGRIVAQTGGTWGLFADTNITQQIGVYTMPVGTSSGWTCLTNIAVDTFVSDDLHKHKITLQSTKPSYVKFASSGKPDDIRTDIVIDDITLTQWCGQTGSTTNPPTSYIQDYFYYTGAWISNRVSRSGSSVVTNRCALLAPRRAESAASPIGIRTPYMKGLGAIVFDYCDADEGAVIELQRWIGSEGNLSGHLGDPADDADWTYVTNWTFTAGESGTKSYYYGLRAPSNGVFRLVIPQEKVREAYAHGEYDPNWAAITITDVYCHDEPAFDAHSWWGWNFLTTGWSDGKGNRYAAIDDHNAGAVGVLNNTLETSSLVTGDQYDYKFNDPFIQSPTFNGRNVGEICFRARCYSPDPAEPSCITVWGAKSGDLQKTNSWHAITNFYVSSSAYTRYTAKCADDEGYAAIRIGVANVGEIEEGYSMKPVSESDPSRRVLIDEIVIRERVKPEVGFRLDFVRPFRMGLSERTAIENIASRDQQPLLNEQFGFQAEVEVTGLADEVDLDRTPVVTLSYYPKAEPWGYKNWKDAPGAVLGIDLPPAEGTNLVFRSMDSVMASFAGPFEADDTLGYGMVQYHVTVKYWDKGGDEHTTDISEAQWKMPSWYRGFADPNAKDNAEFSPFTVLDTVSPGRAWFNEVNFADENGLNANQFVEICFPAGYDMTGWRIYRYDVWGYQDLLATLGMTLGVPSTKEATGGDPNFAFLALTSAAKPVENADANWSSSASSCTASDTYGFQLVRPSGVIEQQIVVQGKLGTGRYSNNKLGTNVVAELTRMHPDWGEWRFVGIDTNAAIKSTGVFQNAGAAPADWNDIMDMTPGMMNCPGQIPDGWFLPPSGTNVWVTLSTEGDLIWIVDGESRTAASSFIIPIDTVTNICFEVVPWYQLGALMRDITNDVTAAAVRSAGPVGATNRWTYAFKESAKNSATLRASAKPDDEVLVRGKLDPDDIYTPAIMDWLLGGTANGNKFKGSEISTNCFFQGLSVNSRREYLPLRDRYWLDIDPTSDDWDLRGGMGEASNLNAPTPTVPVVKEVCRNRPKIWSTPVTNRVVTVTMMISNKVDHALSYPPNRLQGLSGEKSDVVGASNWTSETFKVMMSLIKPEGADGIDVSDRYWPMAMFVFNGGSFGAPDGPNPFAARIEVMDPMSTGSPAYSFGWWKYPGSTYGYKWDLSHGTFMQAPSTLNATNTWDKTWEANDDY